MKKNGMKKKYELVNIGRFLDFDHYLFSTTHKIDNRGFLVNLKGKRVARRRSDGSWNVEFKRKRYNEGALILFIRFGYVPRRFWFMNAFAADEEKYNLNNLNPNEEDDYRVMERKRLGEIFAKKKKIDDDNRRARIIKECELKVDNRRDIKNDNLLIEILDENNTELAIEYNRKRRKINSELLLLIEDQIVLEENKAKGYNPNLPRLKALTQRRDKLRVLLGMKSQTDIDARLELERMNEELEKSWSDALFADDEVKPEKPRGLDW